MGEIREIEVSQEVSRSPGGARLISLIVPVFNEQDAVSPFVDKIEQVFAELAPAYSYEIVFVNDGSRDATEFVIRSRMLNNSCIALINLSRNFGKEAALSAGIDHAKGDACIPIDVDLQDPPELIPEMLALWVRGAQVVNARRTCRDSDTWLKRATAGGFYKIFNALADQKIPQNVGDYRLMDRQVIDVLRGMNERVRFNKALFSWVGFEAEEVTFERPKRTRGSSGWAYWRLWNFALDGIFSSSTTPLRVWTYVGGMLSMLSFLYAAMIFVRTLVFGVDVPGYASTLILILMFGGTNLFAIGILGEYIGRIYLEVRERPLYVLRSVHHGKENT
ncbi:MAG: glycosyltransferase family 2 protein [Pseudomonadota bacterium]